MKNEKIGEKTFLLPGTLFKARSKELSNVESRNFLYACRLAF